MKKPKWRSIYCYRNIKKGHLRFGWCYVGRVLGRNMIRDHYHEHNLLSEDLRAFPNSISSFVIWTGKCVPKEINKKERYYIKEYDCVSPNGYNRNHGGAGVIEHSEESKQRMRKPKSEKGRVNMKIAANLPERNVRISDTRRSSGKPWHSEETRQRMRKPHPSAQGDGNPMKRPEVRKKHKEAVSSPEFRGKARKAHLGKKLLPETIEKLRRTHLGKKLSPETIEKLRKARQGKKHSEETKAKMRKSQQERRSREERRKNKL